MPTPPPRLFVTATVAAAVLLAGGGALAAPAHALHLEAGWSRPAPAGLTTGVGYGVIVNDGAAPDTLLSASSPAAASVELHESMIMHGPMGPMSHMAAVPALPVPAHGRVALAPNGRHLMLMGLKRPLKRGERVPLTLVFQHAGRVAASLAVRLTPP